MVDKCWSYTDQSNLEGDIMIITNAFSFNMIQDINCAVSVHSSPITSKEVKCRLQAGVESAVGHADTAAVISNMVGVEIPHERRSVSLRKGDSLIVAQYRGPRLPEGATTLPEGASMSFLLILIS